MRGSGTHPNPDPKRPSQSHRWTTTSWLKYSTKNMHLQGLKDGSHCQFRYSSYNRFQQKVTPKTCAIIIHPLSTAYPGSGLIGSRLSKASPYVLLPTLVLPGSFWGILRHSQARWDITSLQQLLGLPWVLLPVGHDLNTSTEHSNRMPEPPVMTPFNKKEEWCRQRDGRQHNHLLRHVAAKPESISLTSPRVKDPHIVSVCYGGFLLLAVTSLVGYLNNWKLERKYIKSLLSRQYTNSSSHIGVKKPVFRMLQTGTLQEVASFNSSLSFGVYTVFRQKGM